MECSYKLALDTLERTKGTTNINRTAQGAKIMLKNKHIKAIPAAPTFTISSVELNQR